VVDRIANPAIRLAALIDNLVHARLLFKETLQPRR
jgi:hypothetical protein